MHAPLPYGRFAEQAELSHEDAAAVELLMRRLTNFKDLSGLESLKRVITLPSGRQAAAVSMGGVRRVVVFEPHERPEYRFDGIAHTRIPMLFSGAITKAVVQEGEGVGMTLTEQSRRRLVNYAPNAALPPKDVALERFIVEYAAEFAYFKPRMTGIYTFTQYDKLRPTWYSGAMAEVVQTVSGYGRQDLGGLPDSPLERAQMIVPERYMREIRHELNDLQLPGYSGLPDRKGEIRYGYGFSSCNVVSFDDADKPWLLRINSAGVYAMPLPLVPATTTTAFREYMEEVGDEEILMLLDRFGGLPSGENFPTGNDFEAWRRAGVIIKICDAADFYDHSPMYQGCGWSVNSRGSEGFNTCWSFNAAGLFEAYGYKLKLALGSAERQGLLPRSWDRDNQEDARRLDEYLSALYGRLGSNRARDLAIKYKLRRHSAAEILQRSARNIEAEIDYWDALEMDPIASHSGNMARVTSGPIYWMNPSPISFGKLKFPNMDGTGCESLQVYSPDYKGPAVRCDTVVFGCYVNDELQVVKYFSDERTFFKEEQSTFEDCMIVGSWEETVTTGATGLMGSFYTTAFDDRAEAPPVTRTTKITGRDLGYGQPLYRTPALTFCVGSVSRSRYYTRETEINTTSGFSLDVAICIPVFERDCILYAYQESTTGTSWSRSAERRSMADPTSYQLWTYDPVFHYMGQTDSGNKGEPRPTTGNYVYVDSLRYTPTQCSDFADSGNWLGLSGYLDVSGICAPYTDRQGAHSAMGASIGGAAPAFREWSETGSDPGKQDGRVNVSLSVAGSVRVHSDMPEAWYFQFSPVDAGGTPHYFYRDASRIAIGASEYASISETDASGRRRRWGNTGLIDHKHAYYFTGVINE